MCVFLNDGALRPLFSLWHNAASVEREGALLDGVSIVIGLLELIQTQVQLGGGAFFQKVP